MGDVVREKWEAHFGWASQGLTEPDPQCPEWSEVTVTSEEGRTLTSIIGLMGIDRARLIAAAPALLEALRDMMDLYLSAPPNTWANGVCMGYGNPDEGEVLAGTIADRARAAIAAAAGSAGE